MRTRSLFPFLFDPNEQAGGATPAEPALVAVPEPVAAAPVEPVGDGPWTNDLVEFFDDPETRAVADRFLREKVQPHITRIERDSAPARQLYKDFTENPTDTLRYVVGELYGEGEELNEELADKVIALLDAGEPTPADPAGAPASSLEDLPAPVREIVAERQAQKNADAYTQALEAKRQEAGSTFTAEEISPFVVAAEGDIETAYDAMLAYRSTVEAALREQHGLTAPTEEPAPVPPAALGTAATSTSTTAPPVARNLSWDEAFDETISDLKAARQAPTVVGTV